MILTKPSLSCSAIRRSLTRWEQLLGRAILAVVFLHAVALQAQTLSVTGGLQLWLKADAGVTSGATGAVTGWTDQSGKGNDATQPDEALAPKLVADGLNGKPVLRFDGTDDYLDVASKPSLEMVGDISSYFVVKFDDFATFRAVWGKTAVNIPASTDYYIVPPNGTPRVYRGSGSLPDIGNVDATVNVRARTFVVLGFQMSGTTLTHYLNGQAIGSGEIRATLVDGGTALKIGSRDDFVTKMKGDIAELLIYDRSLTANERSALVNYLQTKYGIVNQPPTINITSPANNATLTAPTSINLTATAADTDGVVAKVDFFVNGALVGTATAPPYRQQLRLETAGTVRLGAVATDSKDATTAATEVVVTVTGGGTSTLTVTDALQLWLKADAGVTKGQGDAVTAWKDQSGKGNDAAQSDVALAPVLVENAANGKPVLRFDGTDDYLDVQSSASLAITGDIASFFVVKFDDFATFRSVWGKTAANLPRPNDYYLLPNSGIPRMYRGSDEGNVNAFVDGGQVPAGALALLGFNQAGTILTHYFNGRASGSGSMNVTPTDSGAPLKVGSRDDLFTKMKGDIAELLIYDKALSDADRAALAIYLGGKYGIPIVQPSNSLPVVNLTAPAAGANVNAPTNVTVTATASDSDGSIVKVDFFANGGLVGTATRSPFTIRVLIPVAGSVALTAQATDNLGGRTTSTERVITGISSTPSPLTVTSGLRLWLKADAGVTANPAGAVSSWVDFSGNFNNASQSDSAQAPLLVSNSLNLLPTIRFDGADDYLEIAHSPSLAITGDITSLFVARFDDFATFRAVWAKTANNVPRPTDYYLLPNSGIPRLFRGGPAGIGNVDATEPIPAGNFVIAGFSTTGPAVTHYLDGNVIGTGEITATPVDVGTPVRIGTRGDFVTRMKGDIAEILVYNTALSDSDRDKVLNYLREKYFTVIDRLPRFTSIKVQGTVVTIEWEGIAGKLEESSAVTGPWTAVAGAVSPYKATISAQQRFFRLR